MALIDATPDIVCVGAAPDCQCIYLNRSGRRLLGFGDDEDLSGKSLRTIHALSAQSEINDTAIPTALREGVWKGVSTLIDRDGREIAVSMVLLVHRSQGGAPQYFSAIMRDMTRDHDLEMQLRQAQKMEAVGQLAGGVAHDFNNMLAAIISYADLIEMDIAAGVARAEDVREIKTAAVRAADLTRQLLAFSRRQMLEPKVLDLNEIVRGVEKMLRRLIDEDIEIATHLSPNLSRLMADPGPLEQVIMNLAVNARDAMPTGGRLTIETADVELDAAYVATRPFVPPGHYVVLAMTDSGIGMDRATQARIFEPFFTTKEQGKGTGLGLATVYGIVKQTGGFIWVYSEPSRGSTFKIYLPAAQGALDVPAASPVIATPPFGNETVLFIEDEPSLRSAGAQILRRHGYTVLTANNGDDAVGRYAPHGPDIDLIASDVVMPGLPGAQAVELLRMAHPEAKVLFMSGYTDATVLAHGVAISGGAFLQKPFNAATLARKIRDVLDGTI